MSEGNFVALGADLSPLSAALVKAQTDMATATNAMVAKFDGMTSKLAGLATKVAAVFVIKDMVKAAADAETAGVRFKAVFGEMSDGMKQWAKEQADAYGRSAGSLRGFLAEFQTVFSSLGFARTQSADLSKSLVKMSMDVSASFGVSAKEAVDAMSAALGGATRSLRQYGIVVTEQAVKDQLRNLGFKMGADLATDQQMALARLLAIMKAVSDTQGAAAKDGETYNQKVEKLSAQFNAMSRALGEVFLPVAKVIVTALQGLATGFLSLGDNVRIGGVALVIFGANLPRIIGMIRGAMTAVAGLSVAMVGMAASMRMPLLAVSVTVAGLVAALAWWNKDAIGAEGATKALGSAMDFLKDAAEWTGGAIKGLVAPMGQTETATEDAAAAAAKAKKEYEDLAASVKGTFAGLKNSEGADRKLADIRKQVQEHRLKNELTEAELNGDRKVAEALRNQLDTLGQITPELRKISATSAAQIEIEIRKANALKETEFQLKRQVQFLDSVGDVFTNTFERGMREAFESGKVNFKKMAVSMLQDMAMLLNKALIMKPILNSLGLSSDAGAFVKTPVTNPEGTAGGAAFDFLDNLPQFHSGLKSDEFMAILQRGETVLTKKDTATATRLMAGGAGSSVPATTVNYNIDARGAELGAADRIQSALMASQKRSAAAEVAAYQRRFPTRG